MWAVQNQTDFAAERNWVRDRNGAEVWIVAVKGTYNVSPDGMLRLSEQQEPITFGPEYVGKPGSSSLRYETDLTLIKERTDVVLNATAYVPNGVSSRRVDVSVQINKWKKTLAVFGRRRWLIDGLGLVPSDPDPFTTMPITYERAFGGVDEDLDSKQVYGWEQRNPIGVGLAVRKTRALGQELPNIEYPDALIKSARDKPAPAGFGAVPAHWSPRIELAGTYDQRWQDERLPLVPDDFDDRFLQFAPTDQQLPRLFGGEQVVLTNLTPQGRLQFRLPRVALTFETDFGDHVAQHRSAVHTVIIEPDFPRVLMVWQTALPCHPNVLKLRRTVIDQKEVVALHVPHEP